MTRVALLALLLFACGEPLVPSDGPHPLPFRYDDCGTFTADGRHCLTACSYSDGAPVTLGCTLDMNGPEQGLCLDSCGECELSCAWNPSSTTVPECVCSGRQPSSVAEAKAVCCAASGAPASFCGGSP